MNYTEAVALAMAGNDRGFGFLYENTYKSKYYLALKYMKNEDAAQDVLQDAYMRAFANLDKLQQPEAFPGWLGTIVANTAKNMLAKNNPMLFSDIAVDDEEESFEYQIEDDRITYQPEMAYTQQETQELVHEMLDTLSPEQRMCVLMFHIEGASISEIAQTLNCSENTVKSRLNYGRKNLRIKAEDLQKKGYKLYGLAPIPFLLLLLWSEESIMAADGTLAMAGKYAAGRIFSQLHSFYGAGSYGAGAQAATGMNTAAGTQATGGTYSAAGTKAAMAGTKAAVKAGFIHTTAGKITALAIAAVVVGGSSFGGTTYIIKENQNKKMQEAAQIEDFQDLENQTGADNTTQNDAADTKEETADSTQTGNETGEDTANNAANGATNSATNSAGNTVPEQETNNADMGVSIKTIYQGVLQAFQNGEAGYTFTNDLAYTGEVGYFVRDLDQDGIPELILDALYEESVFVSSDIRVFTCEQTDAGYQLKAISGEIATLNLLLPSDGNGLFTETVSRGTGDIGVYRITLSGGSLSLASDREASFTLGDDASANFVAANPFPEEKALSDLSGLDGLS